MEFMKILLLREQVRSKTRVLGLEKKTHQNIQNKTKDSTENIFKAST